MSDSEEDNISDNAGDYEQGLTPDNLKSLYAAPNPAVDNVFLTGMSDIRHYWEVVIISNMFTHSNLKRSF
jgi:hypothetical protein